MSQINIKATWQKFLTVFFIGILTHKFWLTPLYYGKRAYFEGLNVGE
jgi:hypothetical protein